MIFRASLSFKYLNFAAFSTTLLIGVKLQKPIYADFVQKYNPTIQQEKKEFKPVSIVKSDERKQSSIGFIIRLLRDDWLLFSSIILVTATSAAAAVYTPIAIGKLVSAIQTLEDINLPAIEIGALFISQGLLTFLDISLVTKLGESLASTLRIKVFDALIRKDQAYLDSKTSAEIQSLQADIQELKSVLKKTITKGLSAGFQIVGSILSLLGTSFKLTFTLVTFLPFVYLGMSLYGRYLRKLSSICRKVEEDSMFHLGQVYSNLKTVRAFVAEDSETKVIKNHVSRVNQSNLWLGINIGAFQSLVIGSIGSAVLGVLYFGGKLVLQGEMTGGQLISFMVQTQNTQKALSSIGVLFSQFLKSLTSAERLRQYIVYENEIPLRGGIYPESFEGQIEFKNVFFTYPTRNSPILKDFSLNVKKGSIISLCGKSGLGKSTVGQLIERFYDVDSGSITIDGYSIKDVDPKFLRENIGYINQEPSLFATTVLENIRYGNPSATDEQVIKASKDANVDEFVRFFPDGYSTIVGERGASLSGGQKQRIAIARALLKDPKVLILDEATSALDVNSEKIVQQALDRLMVGRTVIVIAHRLSTIRNSDMIVVMGAVKGNILESGTHDELMKRRGEYYKLYSQMGE